MPGLTPKPASTPHTTDMSLSCCPSRKPQGLGILLDPQLPSETPTILEPIANPHRPPHKISPTDTDDDSEEFLNGTSWEHIYERHRMYFAYLHKTLHALKHELGNGREVEHGEASGERNSDRHKEDENDMPASVFVLPYDLDTDADEMTSSNGVALGETFIKVTVPPETVLTATDVAVMTQQSKEQLQADSPTQTADQDGEQNAVISVLVPSDTVVTLKESLPVTTSTPALDDRPSVSLAPPSEVTEPSALLHIPVSPAAEGVVDATCASTTITPTSKLKPAIRSRSPSSKSVRFNATAFKHILVFPRGTIPIALLTCPQFTLQDYASIDHLGSGTPPLVVRPANFTFDELSRLDSSRPVRVETVMLTLKESTKTPVLIVRIRVANWGNPKEVVIRYSNDSWTTYTETRAESAKWAGFVEGCDKSEERFSVEIPNMTPGTTVFAVRYSINGREWWDNNMGSDYKVDLAMLPNTTTKQSSSVSQPKWPSMSIWTSEYPPNVFKCAPNPVVEPVVPDSPPLPNPGRRHRPYSFWTNGDWTRDAKSGRLGCGSLPTSERSVKLQSGHSLSLSRPLYADSNGI